MLEQYMAPMLVACGDLKLPNTENGAVLDGTPESVRGLPSFDTISASKLHPHRAINSTIMAHISAHTIIARSQRPSLEWCMT